MHRVTKNIKNEFQSEEDMSSIQETHHFYLLMNFPYLSFSFLIVLSDPTIG